MRSALRISKSEFAGVLIGWALGFALNIFVFHPVRFGHIISSTVGVELYLLFLIWRRIRQWEIVHEEVHIDTRPTEDHIEDNYYDISSYSSEESSRSMSMSVTASVSTSKSICEEEVEEDPVPNIRMIRV